MKSLYKIGRVFPYSSVPKWPHQQRNLCTWWWDYPEMLCMTMHGHWHSMNVVHCKEAPVWVFPDAGRSASWLSVVRLTVVKIAMVGSAVVQAVVVKTLNIEALYVYSWEACRRRASLPAKEWWRGSLKRWYLRVKDAQIHFKLADHIYFWKPKNANVQFLLALAMASNITVVHYLGAGCWGNVRPSVPNSIQGSITVIV